MLGERFEGDSSFLNGGTSQQRKTVIDRTLNQSHLNFNYLRYENEEFRFQVLLLFELWESEPHVVTDFFRKHEIATLIIEEGDFLTQDQVNQLTQLHEEEGGGVNHCRERSSEICNKTLESVRN